MGARAPRAVADNTHIEYLVIVSGHAKIIAVIRLATNRTRWPPELLLFCVAFEMKLVSFVFRQ